MSLQIIILILIIHWIADFWLQTDWQAQNKSKNINALLSHTSTYSLLWALLIYLLFKFNNHNLTPSHLLVISYIFVAITFICHTITDYFTSRLNTYLWNKKEIHYFFVSIGGDQILHYIQLFLTYQFLINS